MESILYLTDNFGTKQALFSAQRLADTILLVLYGACINKTLGSSKQIVHLSWHREKIKDLWCSHNMDSSLGGKSPTVKYGRFQFIILDR